MCSAIWTNESWANESSLEFKGVHYRWPHAKFAWYYSNLNEPHWLGQESGLDLFKKAAAAWAGCGVEISFQGVLANSVKPRDQMNVMGWSKLAKQNRGLTLRQFSQNTIFLKEADVLINTDNLYIQENPRLLQKVITHEFGHALGLLHAEGCHDVMSSAAECGGQIANPPPLIPSGNDLAQCQLRYPANP
jgi:hypothetical protein